MSQKFENIFKEALQNQEVPYDAKAWDALSSRLDKAMPVSSKKPFGPKAASLLAVGLIGAASVWYFASSSNSAEERKTNTLQSKEIKSDNKSTVEKQTEANNNLSTEVESKTVSPSYSGKERSKLEKLTTNSKAIATNGTNKMEVAKSEGNPPVEKMKMDVPKTPIYYNPDAPAVNSSVNTEVPFIATSCQYEETKITNTSDVVLNIEFPSGKRLSVKPKQSKTIQLTDAGLYRITNAHGVEKSFIVHENKAVDFTMDTDNKYKNGIPTTEVTLVASETKATWYSSAGNQSYTGNTAEFHFFKKGTHVINLKATNLKGCVSELTKTIQITEDYDLMAPNAFVPQDIDPRINRFMPYALTQRNAKFKMIILDPKDGGLVYETSDASAGWDGVDRRTGKPAEHASTYIWKVTLENPLPGESTDYKGTVMVTIN